MKPPYFTFTHSRTLNPVLTIAPFIIRHHRYAQGFETFVREPYLSSLSRSRVNSLPPSATVRHRPPR
ncbi:hypothetical protein ACSQ67_010377 [Phaseolus vulgaris]